jgi:hypothetical protein
MAKDSAELAKRFIDASIRGRNKPPSKAAYARALRMAREAIDDLTHVARRAKTRA